MEITNAAFARSLVGNLADDKTMNAARAAICIAQKKGYIKVSKAGLIDGTDPATLSWGEQYKAKKARKAARMAKLGDAATRKAEAEARKADAERQKAEDEAYLAAVGATAVVPDAKTEAPAPTQTARKVVEFDGKDFDNYLKTVQARLMEEPDEAIAERLSKILNNVTKAKETEVKTLERRKELVPKEFVISSVFNFLNGMSGRIFELAERNADAALAIIESEGDAAREKIIEMWKQEVGAMITDSKAQINNAINDMRKAESTVRQMVADEVADVLRSKDD